MFSKKELELLEQLMQLKIYSHEEATYTGSSEIMYRLASLRSQLTEEEEARKLAISPGDYTYESHKYNDRCITCGNLITLSVEGLSGHVCVPNKDPYFTCRNGYCEHLEHKQNLKKCLSVPDECKLSKPKERWKPCEHKCETHV